MPAAGPAPAGDVVVAYRASVGCARWQQRHAESPVPGSWPYGLEQLAAHLPRVRSVDVPPLRGVRARLARHVGVRLPPRGPRVAAALAWDEGSAVDMLAAVAAERYYTGVIWATDTLAAGGDPRRLRTMVSSLRRMDGLWVLSRPQAAAVRSWLGPRCPPVHVVRFGVDPCFYAPDPIPPPEPHVVSVGGDRDRDPATLFEALRLVRSARPGVRITVQSRSDAVPPKGVLKVDRLPHVEVARLLASATVVALATRPNLHASGMTVALEAQSAGVPVVACDTPGMRDYLQDGVTGHLVPPGQPEPMAAEILALLDDPRSAREMGLAGRRKVLASHTVSTMCGDLAAVVRGTAEV